MTEAQARTPAIHEEARQAPSYRRLLHQQPFMMLWGGQIISSVGDSFFNLAVMWVVYTRTNSVLQTAVVQVVWHLSDILFGPIAGVLADRGDRKRILVVTHASASVIVGLLALPMINQGELRPELVLVVVFLLNSLTAFAIPARTALMPAVVDRDLLVTATGWFSTVGQVAVLIGNAAAGLVIATVGAAWAIVIDAASFAAAAVAFAKARVSGSGNALAGAERRTSILDEVRSGWQTMAVAPVVRGLVWLSALINVPAFTGPLHPALVEQRLQGGPAAYGVLGAASVAGGMVGGIMAGFLERRLGAGRLLAIGWAGAGVCTIGIPVSTWLPITAALEAGVVFGLVLGGVASGALTIMLVPNEYRGRVAGITRTLAVVVIPVSTLAGSWLADKVGVIPPFILAGIWILGVAAVAWTKPYIRTASI